MIVTCKMCGIIYDTEMCRFCPHCGHHQEAYEQEETA